MPRKPLKPCSYPGCPRLTERTYCRKHEKITAKNYEKNNSDFVRRKGYGKNWRKIRSAYVSAHPLCERCMKAGRYVPVEEVHHVIPLRDGGTNVSDNLMSLCRKCHAEIHAEMGTRDHNQVLYEMEGSHSVRQREGGSEFTEIPKTGNGAP